MTEHNEPLVPADDSDSKRVPVPHLKGLLLEKYAERKPKAFIQLDLCDIGPGDITDPDKDGHALTACKTYELMHGATVRALIEPDTEPKQCAVMLRKLADWVERSPSVLRKNWESPYEENPDVYDLPF